MEFRGFLMKVTRFKRDWNKNDGATNLVIGGYGR
jgi:hypothetical protein